MQFRKIAVLGLGKVGKLAGLLLHDAGLQVTGFDDRSFKAPPPFAVERLNLASVETLRTHLKEYDAVLSCLPYHLNLDVAKVAHQLGLHYFDLTEDVPTTQAIIEMSKTSKGLMAPQCGLAPGFIGIVGANLANQFETVRSIRLRVGALPQHPTGLLGYAFNW